MNGLPHSNPDDQYYRFDWADPATGYSYSRPLERHQCRLSHCHIMCSLGFEYCTMHSLSKLGLAIKPSTRPAGGLGVFTIPALPADHEFQIPYGGLQLTYHQMVDIYQRAVWGPYCVRLGEGADFLDAATRRGILSVMNTAPPAECNVQFITGDLSQFPTGAATTKYIPPGAELLAMYTDPAELTHPHQEHLLHFQSFKHSTIRITAAEYQNLSAGLPPVHTAPPRGLPHTPGLAGDEQPSPSNVFNINSNFTCYVRILFLFLFRDDSRD
jgi:hypothetical protein